MDQQSLKYEKTKRKKRNMLESSQSMIKRSRRNSESTTTRRVSFSPTCTQKRRETNSLFTLTITLQSAPTSVQKVIFTPNEKSTPNQVRVIM